MEKNTIVITVKIAEQKIEDDLEIPVSITANDLVIALHAIYNLGLDTNHMADCFLKTENPIALLKGNRTVQEFGIHHGSRIIIHA